MIHTRPKKKLGYLPETPPLYPELTVEETLSFAAGLRGVPKKERRPKIQNVLDKTGLADMRRRLVGNLSKGFRQRVGIAQALLHDPPFLILDEPTIGLDPKQILEIRTLIQNMKGERAILLSSHILQEVALVCDRVLIIHRGKLVANGTIDELTGPRRQGPPSVGEYASDLEELFLKLTAEN